MESRKQQLKKEYDAAKRMGCAPGFYSLNCQELIKYGIE